MPRLLLSTLQENYPERISLLLVVNTPAFFRLVWATVRNFFSEQLLKKVHLLGQDMQTMQAFVSPDSLLVEHGGTVNFSVTEFMEQQASADGVELLDDAAAAAAFEGGVDQSLLDALKDMPAAEAAEGAVKTGYLTKQGKVVLNWKRRFFVLSTSGLLYYYKTETDAAPQGVVLLERSTTSEDDSKANGFAIATPLRTWKLYAESAEERDSWRKALDGVIEKL